MFSEYVDWAQFIDSHKMERLEPLSQFSRVASTVEDITATLASFTVTERKTELATITVVAEEEEENKKSNLSVIAPHTLIEDSSLVVESLCVSPSPSSSDSDSDSSSMFEYSPSVSTPASSPASSPAKSAPVDFVSMDAFMATQAKKQRTHALGQSRFLPVSIALC